MTWRWPWVSRSLQEQTQTTLDRWITTALDREDKLYALLDKKDAAYADLLARFHMLKLQGASEPAPAPAPRQKPSRDAVKAAINEKCGNNKELRRSMEAQAAKDRAAGKSDDEIALAIMEGVTVDVSL